MKQESEGTLSASAGLAALRDAAASGDINGFEGAVTEIMSQKGLWGTFWELVKLKIAICQNYNSIIRVADQLINDPNTDAATAAWAEGKKAEAVEGKKRQGCAGPNVS